MRHIDSSSARNANRATVNQFIRPQEAEDRNVFCGKCNAPVKGHAPQCPECHTKFHANRWGYARLCKNPSCLRTEMAGHAHGLCRFHHVSKKQRQANSARQPNCSCGNKASFGETQCSRCRNLEIERLEAELGSADTWGEV